MNYYLNTEAQPNGDYEVHAWQFEGDGTHPAPGSCPLPAVREAVAKEAHATIFGLAGSQFRLLGDLSECRPAIARARQAVADLGLPPGRVNGCWHCCRDCHTA